MRSRAVVFAYHDVGVRCLEALLAAGVEVPLVVTHEDDPAEPRWFASVTESAARHGLQAITPADPNTEELRQKVEALRPDFLFSFYYRQLLGEPLLRIPTRGALNMHGSLLPKYRGRAPVNWAILNGERETGATLHYMTGRADAGDIVDQLSVPILRNDDAKTVMSKVVVAAEIVLSRSLPQLIAGTAPRRPQHIEAGNYFGRRRPEEGRIDWTRSAEEIHNLVRAVAPPFPGAFTEINGRRLRIHRTRVEARRLPPPDDVRIFTEGERHCILCRDGGVLCVLDATMEP